MPAMSKRIRFSILLSAALITTSPAAAQVFPLDTLVQTGPDDQRINIVFLAEGYTSAEMSDFITTAQNALASLFVRSPYMQYQSYFNAYAVEVPSVESGSDHPATAADEPG